MQKMSKQETEIIDFFDLTPLPFTQSCVTIGNFDGVHLGHQAIVHQMVEKAQVEKKPVIVITFYPDPSEFFNPKRGVFYLSTPGEKNEYLCQLGVDSVLTLKFDQRFSQLSAQVFLSGLKEKIGLGTLVVGRDFALGKGRQGTLPVIQAIADELSFTVKTIDPIEIAGEEISSTRIRHLLSVGQVEDAARLLGRYYAISGSVIHGSDRGRAIGLPTTNLAHWPKKKLPGIGVYATRVNLMGEEYIGITNVGLRPTFEDQKTPNIETHILNFDGNIYGEHLALRFVKKIRDEKKFSGVEAFLEQIERDKSTARKIFRDDTT